MARDDQGFGFDPADIYIGRVDATERSEPVDEVCRRLSARRLAFQYAGQAALVVEDGFGGLSRSARRDEAGHDAHGGAGRPGRDAPARRASLDVAAAMTSARAGSWRSPSLTGCFARSWRERGDGLAGASRRRRPSGVSRRAAHQRRSRLPPADQSLHPLRRRCGNIAGPARSRRRGSWRRTGSGGFPSAKRATSSGPCCCRSRC